MAELPTIEDVQNASLEISSYIHHTPVLTSRTLDQVAGCQLYFKCENFQRSGAFKFRGAMNALLHLDSEQRQQGVVTHSSGNHAGALALACQLLDIKCHIVMPEDAPSCKKRAVEAYGASITWCQPGMPAREEAIGQLLSKQSLTLVHPYDDFHVICGQGTAALEFIDQVPRLDILVLPIGGGGLISGCATVLSARSPKTSVEGVEPEGLDEARRSLQVGSRQPATGKKTIADGLQAGIGEMNFSIIQQAVRHIQVVTEAQIIQAMCLIWQRLKIVVEPSSAVPLAAVLAHPGEYAGHVGIILSGGNVDLDRCRKFT